MRTSASRSAVSVARPHQSLEDTQFRSQVYGSGSPGLRANARPDKQGGRLARERRPAGGPSAVPWERAVRWPHRTLMVGARG